MNAGKKSREEKRRREKEEMRGIREGRGEERAIGIAGAMNGFLQHMQTDMLFFCVIVMIRIIH